MIRSLLIPHRFLTACLTGLWLLACLLVCSIPLAAVEADPQALLAEMGKSLPVLDPAKLGPLSFQSPSAGVHVSDGISFLGTRLTVVAFLLENQPALALLIPEFRLGDLTASLDGTPFDAFGVKDAVVLYNPLKEKGVLPVKLESFPEPVQGVLSRSGAAFFLRPGINLVAGVGLTPAADPVAESLKDIGLPLDNLVIECSFGKSGQQRLKRRGTWNKPLGLNLSLSDPTLMIRRETDAKTKPQTRFQMVWGSVRLDGREYFLFSEKALSTKVKDSGMALVIDGPTLSLKTLAALVDALPGKPLALTGMEALPLDSLEISNPEWQGFPQEDKLPKTDKALLALATTKSITLPGSSQSGPLLVVNGQGKWQKHDLLDLALNLSKQGVSCDAKLKELHVGPVSMGSARLKIEFSPARQAMSLSGHAGFTVGKFQVADQAVSLKIKKKSLDFEVQATLVGIGLGKLKGSSGSLRLDAKNSFKLHFSLADDVAKKLLETGVEGYSKVRDGLIQAGVTLSEPDRLLKAVKVQKLLSRETWEDVGSGVKGVMHNAGSTVLAVAAGSSEALSRLSSAADSVKGGVSYLADKVGDGVCYVANKLNPFKKKKSSKKEPAPYVPFEYEVIYNRSWVRDQAHRQKTAASSGVHPEGPVLRDLKHGNYNYSAAVEAALAMARHQPRPTVPPYPDKHDFVSHREFMPWWDLDLGKAIPVGAIVIQGGTGATFKPAPGTPLPDLAGEILKFLSSQKETMKKDGISGAILAVSATVHGDGLMDPERPGVSWFVIPPGAELAIINPMAGSKEYLAALQTVDRIYKDFMSPKRNQMKFLQDTKDLQAQNGKLAAATPKIRYMRLFKPGTAVLGIGSFSVIQAQDAPVTATSAH